MYYEYDMLLTFIYPPSVDIRQRLPKNFDFNLRRDYQNISYKRRAYESVDEKSLSLAMSRKTTKKIIC